MDDDISLISVKDHHVDANDFHSKCKNVLRAMSMHIYLYSGRNETSAFCPDIFDIISYVPVGLQRGTVDSWLKLKLVIAN